MNYALVSDIRMIDIKKPAEESASDFSRETILRRIKAGYNQTKASLDAVPLTVERADRRGRVLVGGLA